MHMIRETAYDMKPLDAVDYLLTILEGLTATAAHDVDGWGVKLTRGERAALVFLMSNAGRAVEYDRLSQAISAARGNDAGQSIAALRVMVGSARRKIPPGEGRVVSCPGIGYRFEKAPL